MAPITIIPKACSCCKGARSSRDKSSNLPLPNILYEGSEGVVAADAAGFIKKGRGSAAGCVVGLCSLRSGGDSACGAEGGGLPLCGNAYKVSVTDSPFCVIWHDRHSSD